MSHETIVYRIMLQSEQLASVLWERIRPHLCDINITGDPHDVHIHGVDTLLQGKWKPLRLNNVSSSRPTQDSLYWNGRLNWNNGVY